MDTRKTGGGGRRRTRESHVSRGLSRLLLQLCTVDRPSPMFLLPRTLSTDVHWTIRKRYDYGATNLRQGPRTPSRHTTAIAIATAIAREVRTPTPTTVDAVKSSAVATLLRWRGGAEQSKSADRLTWRHGRTTDTKDKTNKTQQTKNLQNHTNTATDGSVCTYQTNETADAHKKTQKHTETPRQHRPPAAQQRPVAALTPTSRWTKTPRNCSYAPRHSRRPSRYRRTATRRRC